MKLTSFSTKFPIILIPFNGNEISEISQQLSLCQKYNYSIKITIQPPTTCQHPF